MTSRSAGWRFWRDQRRVALGVARSREVVHGEVNGAESEIAQCPQQPLCVVRIGLDEEIDVTSKARLRVERDGVAAHDERFNALRVQAREQFFEILRDVLLSGLPTVRAARRRPRRARRASFAARSRGRPRVLRQTRRTSGPTVPSRNYSGSSLRRCSSSRTSSSAIASKSV